MDENKSFTVSQSLNGDTIYYIARNRNGAVIARELSLVKLNAAIKNYQEPPPGVAEEAQQIEGLTTPQEELPSEKTPPQEEPSLIEIKHIKNGLQEKVQENRKQSPKKSFWDKLK